MHKRLTTVAFGISFGLLATAAEARVYDFDRNTWSAEDGEREEGSSRTAHRHRASYGYRAERSDDYDSEPVHRSHRGHRHSGGGTSRSCLTASARGLLQRIEAQFGQMQIISTCRPGATIAGTGRRSKHASGEAIDFNAGSRKGAVVRWLIANHKSGGTMTYRGMSHIHVDVGYHFVSLNSSSGR